MEPVMRFKGKVAVVTGGSGGIGQEVVTSFYRQGAKVVVADIRPNAEDVIEHFREKGVEIAYLPMDVSNPDSVRNGAKIVLEEHGGADILVTTAGVGATCPAIDYPDEAWFRVMGINLNGTFFCAREFAKHMIAKKAGSIVCISSIAALKTLSPETHVAYGVSKAGVMHLCKLLANEWAKYNIRINAVAPGYTATEGISRLMNYLPVWKEKIPMGRLMKPSEIADAILFLASEEASAITGTQLLVDGGYSTW